MGKIKQVINYRTSGTSLPSPSNMAFGELAIQYNSDVPKLIIKKADGTLAEFVDWNYALDIINEKAAAELAERETADKTLDAKIEYSIADETARTESTYLKEHQSLDGYYTKSEVDEALSSKADESDLEEAEEVVARALTDIDERLSVVNDLLVDKIDEPAQEGTNGQVLTTDGNGGRSWTTVQCGTSDYSDLTNKPQINSVTLSGNKTSSDLGLVSTSAQTLTDAQKEQARENIGAASEEEVEDVAAQITELEDEIIETLRTSRNCCDKNATDVAVGKYIYDDGTLKSNSVYNTTGYIDVNQGTTYYLIANDKDGTARNIMFYDSQKNPIGTRQSNLSYVTAPENSKYIRATYNVEQWNDVYISDIYGAYDEFNTSDFIKDSMLYQIEGDKIKNRSIELEKLGSTLIDTKNSVNLFNLGACTTGKSFNNILRDSSSYFLSEAIPVESGELYTFTCPTSARFIAFLDKANDTSSISYVDYANAVIVPEGARYVRITVSNNHSESELSFVKGDYTHYEPYHATRNCVKLADENVDASNLAKNINTLKPYQRLSKSASSLASGEKIDIGNINVSKGIFICAHIEGSIEDVLVGISKNGTYGGWIEITDTNVILHKGIDGTVVSTQSHNLSLSDSTLITINRDLGDATVTLFNCETGEKWQGIFAWGVYCGNIFVYNGNSNDTIDVELSFVPKDINERLWIFGDSYMSYTSDSRWMYHAVNNGYTHFLLNAKGGEKSDQALLDFKHLLSIGPRPTMAVWTLGGNDPEDGEINNNWLVNIREFIWLCEYNGITPILYTVPTTADRDHSRKCSWVRNSGYRYIEAALSVEGDEQYTWKGNGTDKDMLGPDRLHPSVYGAVALYAAVLRDLPEISVQGGGGTSDYSDLTNKPSINSATLTGNKSASDLGLQAALTAGDGIGIEDNEICVDFNLVSSNAHVTELLSAKQDKTVVGTSQPDGGMLPDAVYNLGELSGSVTFSLAATVSGNVNHYFFTFSTGSAAPTITWPNGITWQGGSAPTINASKHYDVSILNGYGVAMEA